MHLHLVRHAQSQGNATGDYSTLISDSLSPAGQDQARVLAEKLTSIEFDGILVSPRLRALQTIAPYLEKTGRQAEIWPEMAEACWHPEREPPSDHWPSEPLVLPSEIAPLFTFRNGDAITPSHPESFAESLFRVHETRDLLIDRYGDSELSVLIVVHGHFIRELLNLLLDRQPAEEFPHDNCGITRLSLDGGWSLEAVNE